MAVRISFPISSKCSCCRYLQVYDYDWRLGNQDKVIKCQFLGQCMVNPNMQRNTNFDSKSGGGG